MKSLFDDWTWQPPAHWTRITTIDMHTGGEPLRVITSGLPPIEGRTVLEKRRYFREHYDHLPVPSFVYLREQHVEVSGLGRVRFDVAYGGAFYAIVEAASLGLNLTAEHYSRLIDAGQRIKQAVMAQVPIEHPFERDLSFLYGTIFTGPALAAGHHSRNVTVFAEGEVDRRLAAE